MASKLELLEFWYLTTTKNSIVNENNENDSPLCIIIYYPDCHPSGMWGQGRSY